MEHSTENTRGNLKVAWDTQFEWFDWLVANLSTPLRLVTFEAEAVGEGTVLYFISAAQDGDCMIIGSTFGAAWTFQESAYREPTLQNSLRDALACACRVYDAPLPPAKLSGTRGVWPSPPPSQA